MAKSKTTFAGIDGRQEEFQTLDSIVLESTAAMYIRAKQKDVDRIGKEYRGGKVLGLSFPIRTGKGLHRWLVVVSREDGSVYAAQAATVDMALKGKLPPEYSSWSNMLTRCRNPNHSQSKDYLNRGIQVCERWQNSFEAFLEDMGPKPSNNHSIERNDNDGSYGPENCRWATRKEQARNKRNNRMLTVTANLTEWSEITGVPFRAIHSRIERGWSVKDAVTTPVGEQRSGQLAV